MVIIALGFFNRKILLLAIPFLVWVLIIDIKDIRANSYWRKNKMEQKEGQEDEN